MVKITIAGLPIFLKRTKAGWAVRWGRTVIAHCSTWQSALWEIQNLFEEFGDD